jgi:uncharacterized protein YukE
MMVESQIHNDPERLLAFAQRLKQFAATSDEHLNRVKSATGRLGQTWQDQEFAKFVQQFSAAERRLRLFIEETRKVTPSLEADARKLQEYLRFSMNE